MATQIFAQSLQFGTLQFPLLLVRKENSVEFPNCLGCFYILFLSGVGGMVEDGYAGIQ